MNINWQKVFMIQVIISSIIILLIYFIFFARKNTKITEVKAKELNDEKIIINNLTEQYYDKIDIINNKLIWNNQTSLDINKTKDEIKRYNKLEISFENKDDFIKREKPKITLIITLYNQANYIKPIYASIQQQELKDIEIIFVDDNSIDNTTKAIEELMEKDKRIVYLKNDINRKAFYSRYRAILNSTGEYILIIDPDDLLINNILIKTYITAKKYNLDIVQFYMMIGFPLIPGLWSNLKYKGGILKNNSEIRNIFYYGESRNLADKLIRREIYIKSIKFMGDEFINKDYHINDDDTAFFNLIHVAETYGFLEEIGYFYILRSKKNKKSIYEIANESVHSIFNNLKYFFLRSDNNTIEKINIGYKYFQKRKIKGFEKYILNMTEGFDFALDVLNLYLNSTYFDDSQKEDINNYKSKIINRQNQLK